MTVSTIFQGIQKVQTPAPIAIQSGPAPANLPTGCNAIQPGGGAGQTSSPPTNQTFQAVLTGSGNCSASINIAASNDGINWLGYGVITIPSGSVPATVSFIGSSNFAWYSGWVTAISGTNATCSLNMNA
jgi:hypothetical protein